MAVSLVLRGWDDLVRIVVVLALKRPDMKKDLVLRPEKSRIMGSSVAE